MRYRYTKAGGSLLVQQIALILHQISCHKPYAEDDIWNLTVDRGDFLQWAEVKDDVRDEFRPMVARIFILDFSRRWSAIRSHELARSVGWVGYMYPIICAYYQWCRTGGFWTACPYLCATVLAYRN